MGVWVLGAEVFALDIGRSPQADEEESTAASGGQFELGFQAAEVEANSMDEVLHQLRRVKRGRPGDGPPPMGVR
jgi:hypothetical protein